MIDTLSSQHRSTRMHAQTHMHNSHMQNSLSHMHTLTYTHTHTHTQGYGEVMDDEDEDDEEGMDELMQNPEFLHSVLSSLPGVNPEEALQNLEQMKDQQQQKDNKKVMFCVYLAVEKIRCDPMIN